MSKQPTECPHDVWLSELTALSQGTKGDEQYLTMREICERVGKSPDAVARLLKMAGAAGRLSCQRQHRPSIDGTTRRVPCYRVTPTP